MHSLNDGGLARVCLLFLKLKKRLLLNYVWKKLKNI